VAGVSQGSPILPLYISLFIDDMTEVLEFLKYHMYADDLQIYLIRGKFFLNVFVRLTVICLRFLNGLLPIL
jgi:hypothetical protein